MEDKKTQRTKTTARKGSVYIQMNYLILTFDNTLNQIIDHLDKENLIVYKSVTDIKWPQVPMIEGKTLICTDNLLSAMSFIYIIRLVNSLPKPLEVVFLLPTYEEFRKQRLHTFNWAYDKMDEEHGVIKNPRQTSFFKFLKILPGSTNNLQKEVELMIKNDYNWLKKYGPLLTKKSWEQTYNNFQRCSSVVMLS